LTFFGLALLWRRRWFLRSGARCRRGARHIVARGLIHVPEGQAAGYLLRAGRAFLSAIVVVSRR
jgi:hypothetical protein